MRIAQIAPLFESVPPKYYGGTERSEEHTSELQSRLHLVCRLLLEKKKYILQSILLTTNSNQNLQMILQQSTTLLHIGTILYTYFVCSRTVRNCLITALIEHADEMV